MTVTNVWSDPETLTLTLVAEFDASVERVWQVWADPRKLERWWGPPTWPATFERFEFEVGGRCNYSMTGPDGVKSRGWWVFTAIDAPHRLEFDDGFAHDNWEPVIEMGVTHGVVTLEQLGDRTRMTTVSQFESKEQLNQMLQMGMQEGLTQAAGQIDAILAA